MKSAQFLTQAAERLKVLQVIQRRVLNRFNKLYMYLGVNPNLTDKLRVSYVSVLVLTHPPTFTSNRVHHRWNE